ncbi:MAG: PqqD family protein [Clostridia bacterium]|nr:PqqD family protein [Clostridia bacterium]
MKIKDGFMLREVAGSWIVVPLGKRVVEFNGLMTLSESGASLWRKLEEGADEDELVDLVLKEYDIDEATARADVQEFISNMLERGLCE